jgi:hypothetical protein
MWDEMPMGRDERRKSGQFFVKMMKSVQWPEAADPKCRIGSEPHQLQVPRFQFTGAR